MFNVKHIFMNLVIAIIICTLYLGAVSLLNKFFPECTYNAEIIAIGLIICGTKSFIEK